MSAPPTLATAALGGLLLALSLPPWPVSTGAWPLGIAGAGAVFAAVDGRRLRARVGRGMAAGLGLYLPGLWWMRDFSLPGFVVTVLLEAAILAGAMALAPSARRAGPAARLAAFPAALVLAEAVRGAWPFGGLPLAGIELGQVAGPLAPAARLGGRLLIVALVGLAGAALASAVTLAIGWRPGRADGPGRVAASAGGRGRFSVRRTGGVVKTAEEAGTTAPGGRGRFAAWCTRSVARTSEEAGTTAPGGRGRFAVWRTRSVAKPAAEAGTTAPGGHETAAGDLAPAAGGRGRFAVRRTRSVVNPAAETGITTPRRHETPARLVPAAAALAIVIATAVGGAVAPAGRVDGELTVAAVQGGGPRGFQAVDRDPGPVFEAHLRAGATVGPGVDVVLWPEDVVDVHGVLAGSPEEEALAALAAELRTTLVAGVVEKVNESRFRNAVVVFGPDGRVVDRYDKVHRVPFGEYIPARPFFARLGDVSAVPRDAIAGRGPGVVDTPAGRLGVLISFEVFFQDRGRAAVRAGGRVLLVPTNASSFRTAQVPAHELAVARLRALETGRWVLQAAPTGYSAVVDHHGRVLARSALGPATVLRHDLQLRAGRTVFVVVGPAPVLLLAAATLAIAHLRERKPERGNVRFAATVD